MLAQTASKCKLQCFYPRDGRYPWKTKGLCGRHIRWLWQCHLG